MEKISSFTVNHLDLLTGVYVSRVDQLKDESITTFDLRFTRPNAEPVMDTAAIHALEHLGATFLRNHTAWKERVVYFGPMGCRTGFYLILGGSYVSEDIMDLLGEMLRFIQGFEGDIPGASAKDCGNYLDMNLPMAKWYAEKYYREAIQNPVPERMHYPK